jgi:hypothetical protein
MACNWCCVRQSRKIKEGNQIMSKKKEEKKEESLLQEVCGGDAELHDCLSSNLLLDPLAGISKKDLNTLTEEGEKTGDFRPAMDKAIFEGAQNPGEKERYVKLSKTSL